MIDTARVLAAQKALQEVLGPELAEIVEAIRSKSDDYHIELPEQYTVDLDITDLMSLVARTSNTFHRIARLSGLAYAQLAYAEGTYKDKFKSNLVGANEQERTRTATAAARDEHAALQTVEAIVKLANALESSARIASESARKLLDKVQAMSMATHREAHGQLKDSDFRSY